MTWPWGIMLVRRLVLRSRPPGAGLLDRPGLPSVDVRTCVERHSRPDHFTPRAGARCLHPLLRGPLDAPRTPERSDVTDRQGVAGGTARSRHAGPQQVVIQGVETPLEAVRRTKA